MNQNPNQRPPEPEIVKQWREGPPKCCHTCLFYDRHGHCMEYDMRPPEDFAATVGQCPKWEMDIPF